MRRISFLDKIFLLLVFFGAVNWGLVGLFKFNIVDSVLGRHTLKTRVVYMIIGVAGLYLFNQWRKICGKEDEKKEIAEEEKG